MNIDLDFHFGYVLAKTNVDNTTAEKLKEGESNIHDCLAVRASLNLFVSCIDEVVELCLEHISELFKPVLIESMGNSFPFGLPAITGRLEDEGIGHEVFVCLHPEACLVDELVLDGKHFLDDFGVGEDDNGLVPERDYVPSVLA